MPLWTFGQSSWNPIWKPTLLNDSTVAIKRPAFIIFTREFIKGEAAKQREVILLEKIRTDSLYADWLEDTANKAAEVIKDQKKQIEELNIKVQDTIISCDKAKTELTKQFTDREERERRKQNRIKFVDRLAALLLAAGSFTLGLKF